MINYTYKVSAELNDQTEQPIFQDEKQIGEVHRVYSNKLKRLVDQYFDYRYFLIYEAAVHTKIFRVKKIFRRGKLWFEGKYVDESSKTIITYDNWRIGVPELLILHEQVKIKIEKEIEEPSRFYEGEEVIATWHAVFDEQSQQFDVTLQINQMATIQEPAFYIAIAQATLFIGA
jgi:hypothetical protein